MVYNLIEVIFFFGLPITETETPVQYRKRLDSLSHRLMPKLYNDFYTMRLQQQPLC